MSIQPYWQDETVALYCADLRDVLPQLVPVDAMIVDPPYGETSLAWDRWLDGWPCLVAPLATSMWCFGSMRMFLEHYAEFTTPGWKLSQDIVWEKHNGSGFHADRFKRVHEIAAHWYRGEWAGVRHETPTSPDATRRQVRRKERPTHMGEIADSTYISQDGGPRLMRSVLQVRSMHGLALHPCQKPLGIIDPLIRYACPRGGVRPRSVRWERFDADRRTCDRPQGGRYRGGRTVLRTRGPRPVADRPRSRRAG